MIIILLLSWVVVHINKATPLASLVLTRRLRLLPPIKTWNALSRILRYFDYGLSHVLEG